MGTPSQPPMPDYEMQPTSDPPTYGPGCVETKPYVIDDVVPARPYTPLDNKKNIREWILAGVQKDYILQCLIRDDQMSMLDAEALWEIVSSDVAREKFNQLSQPLLGGLIDPLDPILHHILGTAESAKAQPSTEGGFFRGGPE